MRKIIFKTLLCFVCFWMLATFVQADQSILVSKNVPLLNFSPNFAVNPNTGDVLIVWTQWDESDFSYGQVWGALLKRKTDGKYKLLKPRRISPNTGYHNYIRAAWIPGNNEFFTVWDTWDGSASSSEILGRVVRAKNGTPKGGVKTLVSDGNLNYFPLVAAKSIDEKVDIGLYYSRFQTKTSSVLDGQQNENDLCCWPLDDHYGPDDPEEEPEVLKEGGKNDIWIEDVINPGWPWSELPEVYPYEVCIINLGGETPESFLFLLEVQDAKAVTRAKLDQGQNTVAKKITFIPTLKNIWYEGYIIKEYHKKVDGEWWWFREKINITRGWKEFKRQKDVEIEKLSNCEVQEIISPFPPCQQTVERSTSNSLKTEIGYHQRVYSALKKKAVADSLYSKKDGWVYIRKLNDKLKEFGKETKVFKHDNKLEDMDAERIAITSSSSADIAKAKKPNVVAVWSKNKYPNQEIWAHFFYVKEK